MDKFNLIDMDKYTRKEHYLHYADNDNCTYSVTVIINVKNLYKFIKHNDIEL